MAPKTLSDWLTVLLFLLARVRREAIELKDAVHAGFAWGVALSGWGL